MVAKLERKKAKIRERYNQVPQLTQDIVWESDKNTTKRHIQESQEVIPARSRQGNMEKINTNKKKFHKDVPPWSGQ